MPRHRRWSLDDDWLIEAARTRRPPVKHKWLAVIFNCSVGAVQRRWWKIKADDREAQL